MIRCGRRQGSSAASDVSLFRFQVETPTGVLGPFCGRAAPTSPLPTHSNSVRIRFTSDGDGSNSGFTVFYRTRGTADRTVLGGETGAGCGFQFLASLLSNSDFQHLLVREGTASGPLNDWQNIDICINTLKHLMSYFKQTYIGLNNLKHIANMTDIY